MKTAETTHLARDAMSPPVENPLNNNTTESPQKEKPLSPSTQSSGGEHISTLKLMMLAHFGNPNANLNIIYQCAGCPKAFKGFINYKTHFDLCHENIKNVCKTCYVVFTNENTLKEHVRELELLVSVKIVHQGDEIVASNTNMPPPNLIVGANEVIEEAGNFEIPVDVSNEIEVTEDLISDTDDNIDHLIKFGNKNIPKAPSIMQTPRVDSPSEVATEVIAPSDIAPEEDKSVTLHAPTGEMIKLPEYIGECRILRLRPVARGKSTIASSPTSTPVSPIKLRQKPATPSKDVKITQVKGKKRQSRVKVPTITQEEADRKSLEEQIFIISGIGNDQEETREEIVETTEIEFSESSMKLADVAQDIQKTGRKASKRRTVNIKNEYGEYDCNECSATFKTTKSLGSHKRFHSVKIFQCESCPKKFLSEENFIAHKIRHTGQSPYQCSVCNKSFTIRSSVKKHMILHVEHYKCGRCGRAFITEEERDQHAAQHKEMKPRLKNYQCSVCFAKFHTAYDATKHIKVKHFNEKEFGCSICEKKFHSKYAANKHLQTHDKNRTMAHKCEICEKSFFNIGSLKSHQLQHHIAGAPRCSFCSRVFRTEELRDKHEETTHNHAKNLEKLYPCSQCSLQFATHEHVKLHIKKKHCDIFPCSVCDQQFSTKTALKAHLISHEDTSLTCFHCDSAFKNRPSLRIHVRKVHCSADSTACPFCCKVFIDKEEYNTHYNKEHKLIKCKLCKTNLKTTEELAQHLQEQHAEFSCAVCLKTFSKTILRECHVKKRHNQETMSCNHCNFTTGNKTTLLYHIVAMHFPGVFKCSVCERPFETQPELDDHMTHHDTAFFNDLLMNIKTFVCKICNEEFDSQDKFTDHEKKHGKREKKKK
jgi:KRAB domain-containing zinc finger protein